MNCIFCCIFNDEKYVQLFYLLLQSIYIFGNFNTDEETDILLYTSTHFMNMIKQNRLYYELFLNKIKIVVNDDYDDITNACRSRLDFFHLPGVSKYQKVLYLDTDIIIKGDIHTIFDIAKDDILYVVEEGTIDNDNPLDWWGKNLFNGHEEINSFQDKSAFNSGVILFKNCRHVENLFEHINNDMRNRNHNFFDQPFIVYNAFKYNMFDNKLLNQYCVNIKSIDISHLYSNKIINHFPLGVGQSEIKLQVMNDFFIYLVQLKIR